MTINRKTVVTIITIVLTVAITIVCLAVFPANGKNCAEVHKDHHSSATTSSTTSTTTNDDTVVTVIETSDTSSQNLYHYDQTILEYYDVVDSKKLFNRFTAFLNEVIEASDKNELDTAYCNRTLSLYGCVSECLGEDRESHYENAVYLAWAKLVYGNTFEYNGNSLSDETRQSFVDVLAELKKFEANPSVFPFSS